MNGTANFSLSFSEKAWKDFDLRFSKGIDLNPGLSVAVVLSGRPCSMRVAIGTDSGTEMFHDAAECYMELVPGVNVRRIAAEEFRVLRGKPDLTRVEHVVFGGETSDSRLIVQIIFLSGMVQGSG